MSKTAKTDVLSNLDLILASADTDVSPWSKRDDSSGPEYLPDFDILERLLALPIKQGHTLKQQTGRLAKSLDAYIAYELRRAGFPESAVFPRPRIPRVFPEEFAELEENVHALIAELTTFEKKSGERLKPAKVRQAMVRLRNSMPGHTDAEILGRFYVKQVDVVVSDWRRGPDVLVSGKSMLSSYRKNLKNRYEEAIGEAHNLRDRYPLAAMGYAYIARRDIYDEKGAFELLRDLLIRLRRPDGPFDATSLILVEWTGEEAELRSVENPAPELTLSRFFEDLLGAVMNNTPVAIHQEVRRRKAGEPPGGMPTGDQLVVDGSERS